MRKSNAITIVGAGSSRTPALIGSLMMMIDRFPTHRIVFYDIDLKRVALMEDYVKLVIQTYSPSTEIIITDQEDIAYQNCDFVFCCMRVGSNHMRSFDEKIPLKYGCIGQETCGAGGFAYGMRSIGPMVEMVKKIRSYSQNTWILNYTNPAAIVALALDSFFPNDHRIVNMCDQPYSMMTSFAKILGTDFHKLRTRYFGLNHFGWFTDLYDVDNKSYFKELKNYLLNNTFQPYNANQRTESVLKSYLKVTDMMKAIDEYIPTTYLQYYLMPNKIVMESDPNHTRADETTSTREKPVWDTCASAIGKKSMDGIELLASPVFGNMMVEVAESIAHDLNHEFVIMTKNHGLIPNFSDEAIVEVSGTLGKDGAKGFACPAITPFYKGLMENQFAYEQLTVEAYREKSYDKALQALILNRSINEIDTAVKILDELMEVNKDYWTLERK